MANTETIIINPLSTLIIGSTFLNEEICVDLSLNYTAIGGSFSISLLQGSVNPLPAENTVLSLPFGRVGVVKSVAGGLSTTGLVDTISGVILPLQTTLVNFFGIEPGAAQFLSFLAAFFASPTFVFWNTLSVPIKNFSFRGQSISAIQQLASYMLADMIVRKDGIYVVDPGTVISGAPFIVPKSDIVSANQSIDYSLDVASVLNPALTAVQIDDQGDFVYDSQHAQKQPKFTVQAGAPGSQGSQDFIPIPDGWLVDGNYEEWTPPSGTDFTNPTPSTGRYWKVFQSPTNPALLRGITNFTRMVKPLNLPQNVSTFVGSPITGLTKQNTSREFDFNIPGTESGIVGFNAEETTMFDIISHQFLDLTNALVLIPHGGGSSGDASSNFYSITMEMWTFPRVNPQVFPVGDPVNPFGIPRNFVVVNPNSSIANVGGGTLATYYQKYLSNYRLINSPRLKTTISTVYRNNLPQVGDNLQVPVGMKFYADCGRIQSVSLRFGRSGMVLSITAEKYQFGNGLFQLGAGGEIAH